MESLEELEGSEPFGQCTVLLPVPLCIVLACCMHNNKQDARVWGVERMMDDGEQKTGDWGLVHILFWSL